MAKKKQKPKHKPQSRKQSQARILQRRVEKAYRNTNKQWVSFEHKVSLLRQKYGDYIRENSYVITVAGKEKRIFVFDAESIHLSNEIFGDFDESGMIECGD